MLRNYLTNKQVFSNLLSKKNITEQLKETQNWPYLISNDCSNLSGGVHVYGVVTVATLFTECPIRDGDGLLMTTSTNSRYMVGTVTV